MIRITCVQCSASLEIDDGFAGGVCRCTHCGTVQSVPKAGKGGVARVELGRAKALYTPSKRSEGSGRALSPSEVMGSGLSGSGMGSGLTGGAGAGKRAVVKPAEAKLHYLLYGAIGLIAALALVALWLLFGGGGDGGTTVPEQSAAVAKPEKKPVKPAVPAEAEKEPTPTPVPEVPAAVAPEGTFAGLKLGEGSVVYVVDRNGLAGPALDAVKQAIGKSIDSLHTDQQFQILVWNSAGEEGWRAIPADGPARATPAAFVAAMEQMGKLGEKNEAAITESAQAPAGAAIAQPDFSAKAFEPKQDFSDNGGPPGQTFKPMGDMVLKAVTVKGFANNQQSFGSMGGKVTMTISRVDEGGTLVRLGQESATGGFTDGGAYQTFTLGTPVKLSGGRQYAYDIYTENGFYGFAKSATDVYPGGNAMQHGSEGRVSADGAKITGVQSGDRTFFINPAPAPNAPKDAVEYAMAQKPASMLLITGKGYDNAFAARVLGMRGNSATRIHPVLIGDGEGGGAMTKIAEGAGGKFLAMKGEQLRK